MVNNVQTLKARTIEAKSHLQTKTLFRFLFVGSRGAANRIRIMSALRKKPRNRNQLATELGMDYKNIQHHIKILEGNNLVKKIGNHYGMIYYVSTLFENSEAVFDEIVARQDQLTNPIYYKRKEKAIRENM